MSNNPGEYTKPYPKYAWPGGYPMYAVMHDGESMCIDCANTEGLASFETDPIENSGWQIIALDVNWEDPNMFCCHCYKRIESAYAEDEVGK